MIRPSILAKILFGATFVLLLWGSVVHTTGSSLACPDWPLCYGQFFPTMKGGVLYEHGHRLIAAFVSILTVLLAVSIRQKYPEDRRLFYWAVGGIILVLTQALLGGLTVIYRLPDAISTAHLGTSMLFLAWTLAIQFRMHAGQNTLTALRIGPRVSRTKIAFAACAVYLQLIVGAVVRHTGSSFACGQDVLLCHGALIPSTGPEWLHVSHRVLAFVVMALVIASTLKPLQWAKLHGHGRARFFCIAAHALVLAQIGLGFLTVATSVNLHVVTTHLAFGALLWLDMVALFLTLGPLGCL